MSQGSFLIAPLCQQNKIKILVHDTVRTLIHGVFNCPSNAAGGFFSGNQKSVSVVTINYICFYLY